MKFDQFSDFHVEHHNPYTSHPDWKTGDPYLYPWHTEKQSDILILNGDCSNSVKNTETVLLEAATYYENVLFTDGNHEHWCGITDPAKFNVGNNIQAFRKISKTHANIHYLDGENEFISGDTLFIGACGWYDFNMAEGYTFSSQIANWKKTHPDYSESAFGKKTMPQHLAYKQATELSRQVLRAQENPDIKNIVVATHMVPHEKGLIQNRAHPWYHMNGAFGNSMMRWVWEADFKHKINTWVFGHTHFTYDFMENGIRFVCNPRGYGGEQWKNSQRHILQIDTDNLSESAFGDI